MSDNYKRNGSNSLYKEIVENISDLIVVLNLNYKINYINQPITKKLLGYKKNEIIGTSLMQYIHPDNRNNIEELKKNLGKKEKKRVTVRIKHREGHWIWFEIIGNSLRINENKKNIIFIGRIVTKRKNLKDLYKWLGELLRIERDLSVNLNKAENLKEGLDLCLHAALRVSKMDCGIIYLKKENSNQMEIFTHHNIPEEKLHLLSDFRQFDLDQINCSIYTQYSELEKNIERIHKNEGLKAVGIIPIYHRKRKIGILFVASRTLNQFPKSSREGLEIISSHIESSIIDTKRREKIKQNQKKLKESEERLKILNDTYLKFGKDPIQNIQHLVNAVGRILDADCALYNRIIKRKDKKVLKTLAIYNAPPNYKSEDDPIGHICYDLIESNTDDVVIIKNLDETKYAKTDINVINYDLKMYCGSGVKLNQDTVAMFCVVYTNNKPLKEADINLIRILAESASIEEQRMDAKRKLKESEEKYRLLFETMAQGVVYQEKSGRISTVNPAAKKILGLSDEMIKGRKSDHSEWKVIRADGSKFPGKYHPSMRALKTGKRNKNTIMGIFNPEREEYRWINVNAVPLFREEQKEPYRVYTTFEDITERKIAEEKLKEAVNRSDFYRDLLAHDMGNVLGNINSSLEILEMIGKGAKISQNKEDIMEIIRQAITRGKNLISSVRKLSIIEKHKQTKKVLDIRLFLENGIKHVMNQFQEKDIEISFKMKKNKFYVKAGELLLDAFENILLNAIVHNKKEKIKLWINASKFQKNGNDYIKIEFKDNAIGINDSRKKIIFKKSYKNRESTGGMGIGLSLVKNIIESYNGKIWVEDRIAGKHHEGSNFIILLREA